MGSDLQENLSRITAKMGILLERYNLCEAERAEARRQAEELTQEKSTLLAENQKLSQELGYMKIASTIAPTRNDVEATRTLLAELVREIDKCIADLNE